MHKDSGHKRIFETHLFFTEKMQLKNVKGKVGCCLDGENILMIWFLDLYPTSICQKKQMIIGLVNPEFDSFFFAVTKRR